MNQNDVNLAVAKASGESVETIARHGFVLLTPTPREREPSRADYDDLLHAVARRLHGRARPRRNGYDILSGSSGIAPHSLQIIGGLMEIVIVTGIAVAIAWWLYKAGKREGSRKGFHAGVRRRRFRR